ncbi:hypothetical protein Tco_1457932 [Tanacetum coccineum]
MVDWLSIVETDKVIHTVETDIVKLVVEIKSFSMSSDEFDKETRSFDGLQPMQADLSCVQALNELHLHEIRVVPREPHWTAVKTILKYLRYIKDMILVLMEILKLNLELNAIAMLDLRLIEMTLTALEAAMEVVWIRKFILGLGVIPTKNESINMFCDNSAALLIANEPGVQRGARHYHRRYYYVRECIELGKINLLKVHTDDNLADPYTKALSKGNLLNIAWSMDIV